MASIRTSHECILIHFSYFSPCEILNVAYSSIHLVINLFGQFELRIIVFLLKIISATNSFTRWKLHDNYSIKKAERKTKTEHLNQIISLTTINKLHRMKCILAHWQANYLRFLMMFIKLMMWNCIFRVVLIRKKCDKCAVQLIRNIVQIEHVIKKTISLICAQKMFKIIQIFFELFAKIKYLFVNCYFNRSVLIHSHSIIIKIICQNRQRNMLKIIEISKINVVCRWCSCQPTSQYLCG